MSQYQWERIPEPILVSKNGNISHYEFHVDSCEYFQNFSNAKYLFGGAYMTGFKTPKPVIIFGQDECIFQQYTLHGKQWIGPNGEPALLSKSDGFSISVKRIWFWIGYY